MVWTLFFCFEKLFFLSPLVGTTVNAVDGSKNPLWQMALDRDIYKQSERPNYEMTVTSPPANLSAKTIICEFT